MLSATICVFAVGPISSIANRTVATVLARAQVNAVRIAMAVVFVCPAWLNLNAGWGDGRVNVFKGVSIVAVTVILPNSNINAVAVQSTWIAVAVGVVAINATRIH